MNVSWRPKFSTATAFAKKAMPYVVCTSLLVGIALVPPSAVDDSLPLVSMRLLGVFVASVVALLITPVPISIVALVAMLLLSWSRSVMCNDSSGSLVPCSSFNSAFEATLDGFANEVNWLVFASFHIGHCLEATQLGRRIALLLLRMFGKSLLGIGYAIFVVELILGMVVPSNTARGGAVVMPIVTSIAATLNSTPDINTRSHGGEFLVLCGAHANLLSASFYLTGMAANPLIATTAKKVFDIEFSFLTWLKGSVVPGLVAGVLVPLLLYFISFRSFRRTCSSFSNYLRVQSDDEIIESGEQEVDLEAIKLAVKNDLKKMGRLSLRENVLLLTLAMSFVGWCTSSWTGFGATQIAMTSVVLNLCLRVISWKDVLENHKAWDTFIWLGIFIMMAEQLHKAGVADAFGRAIGNFTAHLGLGMLGSALFLGLLYFYSMYMFSSLTGHIVAFASPFLSAGKMLGISPFLITALLGYFSTLCGCLTNFSSGPIVIYYAQGFVKSRGRWFLIGALVSIVYISVYFSIGLVWWKVVGFY